MFPGFVVIPSSLKIPAGHRPGRFDGPLYNRIVGTGGPDLFVVCKHCGSEVSPYITECPYCGNRLRKRAPKLDKQGRISERRSGRRPPSPSLGRLRRGEIPGIRGEAHPYATLTLVGLGLVGALIWRTGIVSLDTIVIDSALGNHWWRILTAPFVYTNVGYAFVALSVIGIYGILLERRHGPVVVIVVALLGGCGGVAVASQAMSAPLALGGNGAALALLVAWAVPDLLALRARRDFEGDLILTAVLAGVVALMPWAVYEASWIADGVGVLAGLLAGYALARIRPA